MSEGAVINILLTTLGGLATIVIGLIAWLGTRVHTRLSEIAHTLSKISRDICADIATLNTRLTVIEHKTDVMYSVHQRRRADDYPADIR